MFPRRLLIPGEQVVLELRPHPVALALPVIAAAIGTALVVWVADRFDGVPVWIVGAAWLALMLGYVLPRFIAWFTSIFVVTSDRVISREGFIAKRAMEIPLEKVNDVRFEQGIFDRLVGAGTLHIQSASEAGTNSFDDIRHPEEVQRTIYHQGELNRRRDTGTHQTPSRPDHRSLSPSVTAELERLADLRARGVLTEDEFQTQKARVLGQG